VVYFRREYFLLRAGASVARQFAASFSAASRQLKSRPDRRHRAQQFNREISTSLLVSAGTIELIEDRHDLLTIFGIWIHVQSGREQREVFGAKVFCNSFIFWDRSSAFLRSFCITEIEDLAIGLGLSLITTYDADDLLCQFGSIGLMTLSIQRQGTDYQNHNNQ